MSKNNTVLVVGTGTIGEPLSGLLAIEGSSLGVDETIFYKHTPREIDRPLVQGLQRKGASLSVSKEKLEKFREFGIEPTYTFEEALDKAKVVVDCTPGGVGLANKERYYLPREDKIVGFIAQGSENGFGVPFAAGINDEVLKGHPKFVQIVSCNTHNIAVTIKDVALDGKIGIVQKEPFSPNLLEGRFVCIRRANDVSQNKGFVNSPEVGKHDDQMFGTHHARDVYQLYQTVGLHLNLFSSVIKAPTSLLHSVWFSLRLKKRITKEEVIQRFKNDPWVAVTNKRLANQVFSFGREHGHYGRILDQSVVVLPSLAVREDEVYGKGSEVFGFCFTPQDGNSLLSSATVVCDFLNGDGEDSENRLQKLTQYRFDEV